ncbi:hypothetical protein FVER14953_20843 [Fusarium verticillioides]|nr:hypothetical protein FVER14953_20843 [Fusarium verticillioides]
MSRTDDSFSLNDLPTTTLSVEAPVFDWDRSEILYWIVAWAQGRFVDFLPVTPQGALQSLGIGLTATIQQSYVNPRMELAYKPSDPRNLARFLKELQILSIPRIRLHPFIATLEGLSWDVAEADNSISPIFVFQKARLGDLETFMGSERGVSMLPAERLALCCQIAIAMADLEDMFLSILTPYR